MKIEVNGEVYEGFLEANASIFLDKLTSTFKFRTTSDDAKALPFVGGEECVILVSNQKIITGFIESVEVDGDKDTHNISISGRDKTCDLLDSTIGSLSDIKAPISLKRIIQKVIRHIGTDIDVIDKVNPRLFSKTEDITAPEPGQDAWELIEKYARKRQVLLSSNADGDIVITESDAIHSGVTLQHKVNDNTNNVLKYSVKYDTTERYNLYEMITQMSPIAAMIAQLTNAGIVNQSAKSVDNNVRKGRQFVLVAESPGSGSEQKLRVDWERNVRKARARVYGATVNGFRNDNGNVWAINELVFVNDEFAGIHADMLINSVSFSINSDSGRSTILELVEKDAFSISQAEPIPVDDTGVGLFPDGLPGLSDGN